MKNMLGIIEGITLTVDRAPCILFLSFFGALRVFGLSGALLSDSRGSGWRPHETLSTLFFGFLFRVPGPRGPGDSVWGRGDCKK